MKKTSLSLLFIFTSALFLTACSNKPAPAETETKTETILATETAMTETESVPETVETSAKEDTINDILLGLEKNAYKDLEITGTVLNRMAILPGSTVPLTITITNHGDQKVVYSQGSGSFDIPQSLFLDIPGLQPIRPQDHLGAATLDMRNGEILPGETLEYTLHIRAIEPHESFDDYTYDIWNESEEYIGDIEWDKLKESHPELIPAKAGTYEGTIYFTYYLAGDEETTPLTSATHFTESTFSFSITE